MAGLDGSVALRLIVLIKWSISVGCSDLFVRWHHILKVSSEVIFTKGQYSILLSFWRCNHPRLLLSYADHCRHADRKIECARIYFVLRILWHTMVTVECTTRWYFSVLSLPCLLELHPSRLGTVPSLDLTRYLLRSHPVLPCYGLILTTSDWSRNGQRTGVQPIGILLWDFCERREESLSF
jgi:hypothetical protein